MLVLNLGQNLVAFLYPDGRNIFFIVFVKKRFSLINFSIQGLVALIRFAAPYVNL